MAATAAAIPLGNAALSEAEVLRQIDNLKTYVESHKDELPNRIYHAMDGVSRTLLAFLKKENAHAPKGWAIGVVDAAGEALWTPAQAAVLEEAAPIAVAAQAGGGLNPLAFDPTSQLVVPGGSVPPVSLDAAYKQVKEYLASIDKKNREIAATIGPVAFVNGLSTDPTIGPLPPVLPVPLQFPARAILPFLNAFLESIRLLVSSRYVDSPFLRTLSSLILSVFDVLRGNWRDGVLSFLGVAGYVPMMIGIVLKTIRFVYSWISPDIQERLEDDAFAATKSMFVGGWLWLFSTVAPDFVRTMLNTVIQKATEPLEDLNKKIAGIEKQTQLVAKQAGVQVTFPRVPLDKIPTFADIQNFQSLLSNPDIYCSAEFQQALAPAMAVPPLRLFFELMNIPTVPDQIQERCKDQPKDIAAAVAASMKPIVVPLPSTESLEEEKTDKVKNQNENPKEVNESKAGGARLGKTRRRRRGSRKN